MSYKNEISEEILNAFIDGEIDPEDKVDILHQLSNDPELTKRVCELIRTQELVRAAYRDVTPRPQGGQRLNRTSNWHTINSRTLGALAASLLVAVLLTMTPLQQESSLSPISQNSQSPWVPTAFQQVEEQADLRIVFHLTTADPLRAEKLLDDVQLLLTQTQSAGKGAVVEVIANGDGLGLFRSDVSAFGDRIHLMSEENSNLRFLACQRTIDRIESGGEGKIRLLPDVVRAGSGISQVVQRQQQGWSYIQI